VSNLTSSFPGQERSDSTPYLPPLSSRPAPLGPPLSIPRQVFPFLVSKDLCVFSRAADTPLPWVIVLTPRWLSSLPRSTTCLFPFPRKTFVSLGNQPLLFSTRPLRFLLHAVVGSPFLSPPWRFLCLSVARLSGARGFRLMRLPNTQLPPGRPLKIIFRLFSFLSIVCR